MKSTLLNTRVSMPKTCYAAINEDQYSGGPHCRPFIRGSSSNGGTRGAEIYTLALPIAGKLYLTWIESNIAGDAYFPAFNLNEWQEVSRESHPANKENLYPYFFSEYRLNPPKTAR